MKECTKCHEVKPDTEFYRENRSKSGLSSWCRECTNAAAKDRRLWYIKHGICVACGQNDAWIGHQKCPDCIEKSQNNNAKYRSIDLERSYYEKRKKKRLERINNGFCEKCGKKKATNGQLCNRCWNMRQTMREKEKAFRGRPGEHFRERRDRGVCLYCCKEVVDGYCFCDSHLRMKREIFEKAKLSSSEKWRKDITAEWENAKYQNSKIGSEKKNFQKTQ